MTTRAAVVVLNFRAATMTVACIESLVENAGMPFDLVVVDNASADGSLETIAAFLERATGESGAPKGGARNFGRLGDARRVGLVESPSNDGYSAGNNLGIRDALAHDAEYIWIVNNDMTFEPGALAHAVRYATAHPRAGAIGSVVLHGATDDVQWYGGGAYSRWTGRIKPVTRSADAGSLAYITGCALLVPAAALCEIGGLVEGYFLYGEELDFCTRLARAGWSIGVAENSRVHHFEGATTGSGGGWRETSTLATWYASRNNVLTARRHFPSRAAPIWAAHMAFAVRLLVDAPRAGLAMLRGACRGLVMPLRTVTYPRFVDPHDSEEPRQRPRRRI